MILFLAKYTLVLIFALVINRLKAGSASARHAVLAMALFSLPVLWVIEAALPEPNMIMVPTPSIDWQAVLIGTDTSIAATDSNRPAVIGLLDYLLFAYLTVMTGCAFYWLGLAVRTQYQVRQARTLVHPDSDFEVRLMPELASPFAWGVIHRVIVMPGDFPEWGASKQKMVLDHEASHLRRYDVGLSILSAFYCSLLWFHPLVWWTRKQMLAQAELACDDAVLTKGHDPLAYAEELVQFQKSYRPQMAPSMASKSDLKSRVHAMLDPNNRRTVMNLPKLIGLSVLSLIVLVPLASVGEVEKDPSLRAEHFDELKTIHTLITDEKDYVLAKERLDKALAMEIKANERAQYLNLLGYTHFLEQNFDQAIEAYTDVVTHDGIPKGLLLTTYYTLAQLHFVQERYEGAIEWIDAWHAIAEDPGPNPTIFRAQTLFQMGKLEEALMTLDLGLDRARARGHEINPKWLELKAYLEKSSGSEPAADLTSTTDGGVMLIAKVHPVYPIYAEKRGLEGYVDVQYGVTEHGNVVDAKVTNAEPVDIFDTAALAAVSKYKYKPTVQGGVAVPTRDLITRVQFRLED